MKIDNSADLYFSIAGTIFVLLLLLAAIITLLFVYQNKQIHHQLELKRVKNEYEQETLKTQLEIREQTLKNVSQEIHDNIGQILSLANLTLSSIELEQHDPEKDKLESVMRLVSKSIEDLRNISRTLDPINIAGVGLVPSLRLELQVVEKTGRYHTSFQLSGTEKAIDPSKLLLLYRITQEAINNIIRHASAKAIDMEVNYLENELNIRITDDGKGFDLTLNSSRGGAGLTNMAHRAKLIQADFRVDSTIGKGTQVTIRLPLENFS